MLLQRDMIRITPVDRTRLQAAGLDTADSVLKCIGDQVVAWSRSTDAVRVDLPASAGGGAVFLKRYHHLRWRQRIKAMLRGAFFGRSRAKMEYQRLCRLEAAGVPVVHAMAYGERRIARFLRSCFLITEAVPNAEPLTNCLQRTENLRHHRKVVRSLGRCVRRLHAGGIVHGALFWRNILVRGGTNGDPDFVLLDMPAEKRLTAKISRNTGGDPVGDLAALAADALECRLYTDMMRFLLAYTGAKRLGAAEKDLARRVLQRSEPLRAHEAYRLKMHRIFHYHLVPA